MDDMEIISAVFTGSVIREGFGKIAMLGAWPPILSVRAWG